MNHPEEYLDINWSARVLDALSLFLSFLLSVSIIMTHKFLYISLEFQGKFLKLILAGTFLMALNFLSTFLLCIIICITAHYYDFENYKFKWIPFVEIFKMSISSTGSVVFGNLSLIYNSVGFFQVRFLFFYLFRFQKFYKFHFKLSLNILFMEK